MNKLIVELFKDGDNDGNIFIISCNEKRIRCHSFIIKKQAEFFRRFFSFSANTKTEKITTIKLAYDSNIILMLLNKMYNSNYISLHLTPYEIIQYIKLLDELQVDKHIYNSSKDIIDIFDKQLDESNWLEILHLIIGQHIYTDLMSRVENFFFKVVLDNDDLIENDPLQGVCFDSEIGKYLYKLVLKKLMDNKKHSQKTNDKPIKKKKVNQFSSMLICSND